MSSLLSKVSSALSWEPNAGATNAAEPFAACDKVSKMKMLPAAVEWLCDSLGCCISGCLCPTSTRLLDQSCCWAELGVAGVQFGKWSR